MDDDKISQGDPVGDLNDGESEEEGEQIRVSLVLAEACRDRTLQVPSEPLTVPASIGRQGLSTVLNHLLDRRIRSDDDEDDAEAVKSGDDRPPGLNFDFVVGPITTNRRLLRTGLEKEARRAGLSLEEAVLVTYFPAQEAPESAGESEHLPDWISGVVWAGIPDKNRRSGTTPESSIVCTAVYDGTIHLFRPVQKAKDESKMRTDDENEFISLQPLANPLQAHKGPIKCIDALTIASSHSDSTTTWIATGSMDHTLAVHSYHTDHTLSTRFFCVDGHASSIGCVDLRRHQSGHSQLQMASGDWDGGVCVWDFGTTRGGASSDDPAIDDDASNIDDDEDLPTIKKKRTGKSSAQKTGFEGKTKPMSPSISIQAHTTKVSGISFGNHLRLRDLVDSASETASHLITGSWDHSLKLWDIERQDCLSTMNGSRVVSCLDTSYHTPYIVASGHPDCMVRLWDMRGGASASSSATPSLTVADTTFRPSHKSWISSVHWSRSNPYHLASTSHDGTIKMWDIRSSVPLHTVRTFPKGEKGLCIAYGEYCDGMAFLLAGGTDRIIKQFGLGKQL